MVEPPLSQADLDFLGRLQPTAHPLLREQEELSLSQGIPSVDPATGRLLGLLVAATQALNVVEMGTAIGYSSLCMALAMPAHGRIVGTEIDPARAEQAYEFHRRAGQQGKLEILLGPILDQLPKLAAGSFDLAFIDAAKAEYPLYLKHAIRLVRPGGLIVADNLARTSAGTVAQPGGSADLAALQEFDRAFTSHPSLLATILPLGDGIGVAVLRDAERRAAL